MQKTDGQFHGSKKIQAGVAASFMAVSLVIGLVAPTLAEDDVVRRGDCTGAATWRMEVDSDEGRLDFELFINGTSAYRQWSVHIRQDGVLFYSRYRTANQDGNFEVERDRPNTAGIDTFTFRALQLSNGQVCSGRLTY